MTQSNPIFTCTGNRNKGLACPATKEAWMNMVQSHSLKEAYERIANLPYDSKEQNELKSTLPFWTPHCKGFQNNHRNRDSVMQPLRRVVVDLDNDKGRAKEICQKALQVQEQRFWRVLLVEESARGGVHIMIDIPEGMTAIQAATAFAGELGEEFDTGVVTPEHFLYMSPNILYIDEERFFNPTAIPLEQMHTVWSSGAPRSKAKRADADNVDYKKDYVTPNPDGMTYEGIPMEDIVSELEHTIGGGPAIEGHRNEQVFGMARLMRQLTGNDAARLQAIIPTYGLDPEEHLTAIENALRYTRPLPNIPHDLQRAIERARKANRAIGEDLPPCLPENLPPSMQHILSASPEKTREAIAMGAFSPLRVLMSGVKFHYVDNTNKEPCFINLCIGDQGIGKSGLEPVIEAILQPIAERDKEGRRQESEWREKWSTLGANKDKPQAPKVPIQRIYSNVTLAALNKRAHLAGDLSLYTYAPEAEKFFKMLPECSTILRQAFDSSKDGQERVGAQSVSDEVFIRWSINMSTQPATARYLLKNEFNNGLVTRACASTVYTSYFDWGEEMPVQGDYGEQYQQGLKTYLNRLMQAKGIITCTEAEQWMLAEKKKHIERLRNMDAKYFLPYLWRSLLQSFWRACMLYIMEGYQWSQEIADFASWSCEYDLWVKMHFFGDLIENACNNVVPDNSKRRTNLLALLPDEFTREQARSMRRDLGKGTSSKEMKNMIAQWVHCKKIRHDKDRDIYVKLIKDAA